MGLSRDSKWSWRQTCRSAWLCFLRVVYQCVPCCCSHVQSIWRFGNKRRCLNEAGGPHQHMAVLLGTHCVVCTFLRLECEEVDKIFGERVTAHLYKNCVSLFIVILCSCYRICLWCFREWSDRRWTHSWWYVL